ncbi:MAG: indole-3-glycerol phosphate synthase TrpC [Treponema sp.]|jgi:indole-3-glycerol phosphate synthase|nr:indole-3-glycerol phosphate synthase TrpC [Treponema sp.]
MNSPADGARTDSGITILDEIAGKTRLRVAKAKEIAPFKQVRKRASLLAGIQLPAGKDDTAAGGSGGPAGGPAVPFPFERALGAPGLSVIAEVKRASPSRGIIDADFPYLQIAREYEAGDAAAVSTLTEPEYFLGSDQHLREIASAVKIPVLRKDFIIDPYQLYEAKLLGAEAALLICALLNEETLASYIKIAAELRLSALVEIHNEPEAERALRAGARIIGINNRDLKTFNVDPGLTACLRKFIPDGILTVAESGIKSPEDVRPLKDLGIDAVLVGESLMRAADKKRFLTELRAV